MNSSSILRSTLRSTLHDRERRAERNLTKADQLRARRYGMVEPGRDGTLKVTYQSTVLIWDPQTNSAITSWSLNDGQAHSSGTRQTAPVLIQKSAPHDTDYVEAAHTMMTHRMQRRQDLWTSHTVLVVDMSGSMRTDDVDGARCRSDAVWTCLARDFVQRQLDDGTASLTDVVSVVLMRDQAEIVLECEPTTYVLYNKLVEFREWTAHKPAGHGNYAPALEQAELLLNKNQSGSCAAALVFVSDGRPSDPNKQDLPQRMGELASRIGRRLSVTFVGMAHAQDFTLLEHMADEARAFGAMASFNQPSMNADSLSQMICSHVTSSLTATKTELTHLGQSLTVRSDLIRERHNAPNDHMPTQDWRLFNDNKTRYTVNVWGWQPTPKRGDSDAFCRLMDPRCAACFETTVLNRQGDAKDDCGVLCNTCHACAFCWNCIQNKRAGRVHPRSVCQQRMQERRQGALIGFGADGIIPSFSVAWKRQCFGEGAERVAFKFRFLDEAGNFTGPIMVAKESRFVDDNGVESNAAAGYLTSRQHRYHVEFMRTQFLASVFAKKYNETLQEWEAHFERKLGEARMNPGTYSDKAKRHISEQKNRIQQFPRIRFLTPRVWELVDKIENKTYNVLVEPFLDGNYRKYNTNNGGLNDHFDSSVVSRNEQEMNRMNPSLVQTLLGNRRPQGANITETKAPYTEGPTGLGAIDEGDECTDGEDSDDENKELQQGQPRSEAVQPNEMDVFQQIVVNGNQVERKLTSARILDEDFMQAFSHFSYVRSGGRLIVVDLQGTLDTRVNGTKEFVLTDPAIHKRRKSRRLHRMRFGRTDRGDRGIRDFFTTHTCNDACRLLGLKPKEKKGVGLLKPTVSTSGVNVGEESISYDDQFPLMKPSQKT